MMKIEKKNEIKLKVSIKIKKLLCTYSVEIEDSL